MVCNGGRGVDRVTRGERVVGPLIAVASGLADGLRNPDRGELSLESAFRSWPHGCAAGPLSRNEIRQRQRV
jgi:hypothetical protein